MKKELCNYSFIIEKILYVSAILIAVFHSLIAAFQYIIPYLSLTVYLRWAGLCLLIVALIYLFFSLLSSSNSRKRVLCYLKNFVSIEQLLLIGLMGWFIVSCIAHQKREGLPYLYLYDWSLFDLAVCIFILFPLSKFRGLEETKKTLEILAQILIIAYSLFTVFCLWNIFQLNIITFPSGEQGGMTAEFELQLGAHYNLTGMIAVTIFCLSVYMVYAQKKLMKLVYIFCSIIQLIVIYLSNSRTIFIALLLFGFCVGLFTTLRCLRVKQNLLRFIFSLVIAIFICMILWGFRELTFAEFDRITDFRSKISEISDLSAKDSSMYTKLFLTAQRKKAYQPIVISSTNENGVRSLNNISSREAIWIAAFRVIGSNPFVTWYGVTSAGITDALKTSGGYWADAAHTHNSVLQVGTSMGVPAMFLLIAFLLCITIRCVRVCIMNSKKLMLSGIVASCSILCFEAINMAESYLIGFFTVIGCIFFLFSGYITALDQMNYKQKRHKICITSMESIIISALICMSLVSFSSNYLNINPKRINGSGSILDPYLIEDKSDLDYFRDLVNFGNKYDKKYFYQTADIDLESERWKPIGTGKFSKGFYGTYNGGNHKVENLLITEKCSNPKEAALFANLRGVVQNVTITSGSIYGIPIQIIEDVNKNLLLGTANALVNCRISDSGFNASLKSDDDGIVVNMESQSDQGWLVLFFDDGRSKYLLEGPSGESYTLSFDVRANIDDALINVSHKDGNAKNLQIDFGTVVTGKANEWNHICLTSKLLGAEAVQQGIYFDLRHNPAKTQICINNIKLVKGEIDSSWSPAPEDYISLTGRVYNN